MSNKSINKSGDEEEGEKRKPSETAVLIAEETAELAEDAQQLSASLMQVAETLQEAAAATPPELDKKSKTSFELMTQNVFARPRKFYCKFV